MQKHINKKIERKYLQGILGIGKSRFFELVQSYRNNPEAFSVEYKRSGQTRSIDPEIKKNIIKKLTIDKKTIENKDIPLYRYNYSYVQTGFFFRPLRPIRQTSDEFEKIAKRDLPHDFVQ